MNSIVHGSSTFSVECSCMLLCVQSYKAGFVQLALPMSMSAS